MLIGAQLYAFGVGADVDPRLDEILPALAEAGYDGVEGAPGHTTVYADRLAAHGLRFAAPHGVTAGLRDGASLIEYVKAMGAADVCSSGLLSWHERSAVDYRQTAEFLEGAAKEFERAGVTVNYHNHDFEFEKVEGERTGMDLLLERVGTLCVDVGWIWRMGIDPAEFLRANHDRVGFVHLRDFRGEESLPLGDGDIDLSAVVAELPNLPRLRWVIVEQDPGRPDPVDDLRRSRSVLRSRYGI
jgi:sugar phosphate isomerase/epimerase